MNRRTFLARLGAAGTVAGLGTAAPATVPRGRGGGGPGAPADHDAHGGHRGHAGMGTVGRVDHERNGFHPLDVLTDFDAGATSRDRRGRTVHEYEIATVPKDIEVAPGVVYPAWTYAGRVPGPTIRVTEGDRVRISLGNGSDHPHTMHFHGIHAAGMDGVPGAGEVLPGELFTYDFVAEPFGTHVYHCHSLPLREHIARGLYGAFIVDPPAGRPEAHEMVMVMNAFDTDFDGDNEIYAANTVAFAYDVEPIPLRAGEPQRLHVVNVTEHDPLNSIHLHANFFRLYRTGTSLEPDELTDVVTLGQAERAMLEFAYREPGQYMFHAHQTEFTELGWTGQFEVT
jgi:FtsP/CotA-like multicopper oxidase with cupredoxin domain